VKQALHRYVDSNLDTMFQNVVGEAAKRTTKQRSTIGSAKKVSPKEPAAPKKATATKKASTKAATKKAATKKASAKKASAKRSPSPGTGGTYPGDPPIL